MYIPAERSDATTRSSCLVMFISHVPKRFCKMAAAVHTRSTYERKSDLLRLKTQTRGWCVVCGVHSSGLHPMPHAFCYRGSTSHDPFRSAVPSWGQTT